MISMEEWIALVYTGEHKPSVYTVRFWIKTKRIQPAPEKHGRRWMFDRAARYCGALKGKLNGQAKAKARAGR